MSTENHSAHVSEFEFTREEQWAIHQAFYEYVRVATRHDIAIPQRSVEVTILEKLEDDTVSFTPFEVDRIRYECDHHANSEHAPDRDREPARSVVEKIDDQCRRSLEH